MSKTEHDFDRWRSGFLTGEQAARSAHTKIMQLETTVEEQEIYIERLQDHINKLARGKDE